MSVPERSSAIPVRDVAPLEVKGLDVRYPEAHALKGVDISIAPGTFVLIGGRSGSGKSTLAHALLGLLGEEGNPSLAEVSGEISVGGLSPLRHSVAQLAMQVGLVFQNPPTQLFNGTVEDEVAFGPRNLGLSLREIADRVEYALGVAGCEHLRARSVRHLSGGEQQRVAIAASLAMRPSALILDEPTANLDSEGIDSVVQALTRLHQQFRVTVVVIEHRLEPFLPYAQRLIWMDHGRVVADMCPEEALKSSPVVTHLPPFAIGNLFQPLWKHWADPSQNTCHRYGRSACRKPSHTTSLHRRPGCDGGSLVTVEDVTAGYDGHMILRDCSFSVQRGEIAALVGPNGAGKSTLARVLAGLLRPRRGRVVWHAEGGRCSRVGFLQQNPLHQLVCQVVEEELRFGPCNLGMEREQDVEELLGRADLSGLRQRPTQTLSVGEQQRTALAATLSLRPSLLILDEPTMGLDWSQLSHLMAWVSELNRQGQTVLLITHDHRLVDRYADRVWEMVDGEVEDLVDGC